MPEVPVVERRLLDEISREALQVSNLEIRHSNGRPALVLSVACRGWKGSGDRHDEELQFALSPPAAAQLSELLAQAVQEYLYGPHQDDKSPEDQG